MLDGPLVPFHDTGGDPDTVRDYAQAVNLDDFAHLRRWFNDLRHRPATVRAYAEAEPYSAQPAVTEESKKLLFGQTAASVVRA